MIYIRPKFKVSQKVWTITQDSIKEIEIEFIHTYGEAIGYGSKNQSFAERFCFSSRKEAEDFLENAVRIPTEGQYLWYADLWGVKYVKINKPTCFFRDDLKKPYNGTYGFSTAEKNVINSPSSHFFENYEDAANEFLKCRKDLNQCK